MFLTAPLLLQLAHLSPLGLTAARFVPVSMGPLATLSLGSATVLLAISGIGECEALGSWIGAGGGGAQFIQLYITRDPGAKKSAPWAASVKTVLRPVTVLLAPVAFLLMARVCANMASQATAALSASVRMAAMV